MINETIEKKLKTLPNEPGVYVMYDDVGSILYVGKAKILKNRVRQYFHNTQKPVKVNAMLAHVVDFSYIIVNSEADALSLENTLIKKHNPPFNVLLKDDKQYPYVKVNLKSDFPRFLLTRKLAKDGCSYFGPFTFGGKTIIDVLHTLYPLVDCNKNFEKLPKNFRPCLNYHIGKCLAPCAKKVTKEEYSKTVENAVAFLKGETKNAVETLQRKMLEQSEQQNYETALVFKGYLDLIDKIFQKQVVVSNKPYYADCFSVVSDTKHFAINHLKVKNGKIVTSENFFVTSATLDEQDALESFICEYCSKYPVEKEVLLNKEVSFDAVENVLQMKTGTNVRLVTPQKGEKKQIVLMSQQNATHFLENSVSQQEKRYLETVGAVLQLKQLLHLETLPKRMECYDVSNVSGVDKVSSMVVFENGERQNSKYRRFVIKTVEGANDFASIKETLCRRLARLEDESFGEKPDLIVIDGGLGQLHYAQQALEQANCKIEIISLAKREELVYTTKSNAPVELPKNCPAHRLLINIRDESHRFAIETFRKRHNKNALRSILEQIEGVGEKRRMALQKQFKTIEALQNATVEELKQIKGLTAVVAQKIFDFFHR